MGSVGEVAGAAWAAMTSSSRIARAAIVDVDVGVGVGVGDPPGFSWSR